MKTFQKFITEARERDDYELTSITRKPGEGGRIRASRKKTDAEKRRTKVVDGKRVPVDYKPRKDIGTNKPRSRREQHPEKERGSAALSAREAQKKAYRELKARERGTKTKTASELLSKKDKPKTDPKYKPQKASGYTRTERQKMQRMGDRMIKDIKKGKDKPGTSYK